MGQGEGGQVGRSVLVQLVDTGGVAGRGAGRCRGPVEADREGIRPQQRYVNIHHHHWLGIHNL